MAARAGETPGSTSASVAGGPTPQTAKLVDVLAMLKESDEVPTPYAAAATATAATSSSSSMSHNASAGAAAATANNTSHHESRQLQPQVSGEDANDVCNCRKSRCLKLYVAAQLLLSKPAWSSPREQILTTPLLLLLLLKLCLLTSGTANALQQVLLVPRCATATHVPTTRLTTNYAKRQSESSSNEIPTRLIQSLKHLQVAIRRLPTRLAADVASLCA